MEPINEPLFPNSSITAADALYHQDGIHIVYKDRDSKIIWANELFLNLIGSTWEETVGINHHHVDVRKQHDEWDRKIIQSGKPVYNLHEVIPVPSFNKAEDAIPTRNVRIVTQKGLLRENNEKKSIIGITVCFALQYPEMEEIVNRLKLFPVPIGGLFSLIYPNDSEIPEKIDDKSLPKRFQVEDEEDQQHCLYSMDYLMLPTNEVLALHTLKQDEQWFHNSGASITLHIFDLENKEYTTKTVGKQHPSDRVPYGKFFGGEIQSDDEDYGYGLFTCSLSPGWKPSDPYFPNFKDVDNLRNTFPKQADLIDRLFKPELSNDNNKKN